MYISVTVTCYTKRPEDAIGAGQLLVGTSGSIGHVMDPQELGGSIGVLGVQGPKGSNYYIGRVVSGS